MRFTLKGPFKDNLYSLFRRCGYSFLRKDPDGTEFAFSRPPSGYPRFHIYLRLDNEDLDVNLHLDQRKPIYSGTTAHSGEYEGESVEKEAKRIKEMLEK
jgi:hypothetical protein